MEKTSPWNSRAKRSFANAQKATDKTSQGCVESANPSDDPADSCQSPAFARHDRHRLWPPPGTEPARSRHDPNARPFATTKERGAVSAAAAAALALPSAAPDATIWAAHKSARLFHAGPCWPIHPIQAGDRHPPSVAAAFPGGGITSRRRCALATAAAANAAASRLLSDRVVGATAGGASPAGPHGTPPRLCPGWTPGAHSRRRLKAAHCATPAIRSEL
ncbi:unnamed protein product [Lampetra planeri]